LLLPREERAVVPDVHPVVPLGIRNPARRELAAACLDVATVRAGRNVAEPAEIG
jgi:hypothetical protein